MEGQRKEALVTIADWIGVSLLVILSALACGRASPTTVVAPTPSVEITAAAPTPTEAQWQATAVATVVKGEATPSPAASVLPTPSPTRGRPKPATSPPTRLVIPKIGLDSPVVPVGWKVVKEGGQRVVEWEVAEYAVGWHKDSAYPGQGGNVVLSGHHNTKGEVFRYLNDLNRGDEVILYVGEEAYPYQVAEKWLLLEEGAEPEARLKNAQWMEPTDEERLTLITSWPYASRSHRLIVVAHPLF